MTFSYSADPSSSQLDEVRFLVHDTDDTHPLLADEEIEWVLARQRGVYDDPIMAAAICADIIGARYAGEISISADGVSISGDQLQTKYTTLAAELRATYKALTGVGGLVYAGGLSFLDRARDPYVRPLNFGLGMHDNTRAGGQRNDYDDDRDWIWHP